MGAVTVEFGALSSIPLCVALSEFIQHHDTTPINPTFVFVLFPFHTISSLLLNIQTSLTVVMNHLYQKFCSFQSDKNHLGLLIEPQVHYQTADFRILQVSASVFPSFKWNTMSRCLSVMSAISQDNGCYAYLYINQWLITTDKKTVTLYTLGEVRSGVHIICSLF